MGRSRGLRSFSSYSLRNVKHLNHCYVARIKVVDSEIKKSGKTRADPDLNQGPADLQSAALTTELSTLENPTFQTLRLPSLSSGSKPLTAPARSPHTGAPPTGAGGQSSAKLLTLSNSAGLPVVHNSPSPHVVDCLHVNIRSFLKHSVELEARLDSLKVRPVVVGITESWLHEGIEKVSLTGYTLVVRRDRSFGGDSSAGGGILLFVRSDVCCVSHLFDSKVAERSWVLLHSDFGPILFCIWYRPPRPWQH